MQLALIHTLCQDEEEAKKISKALLTKRLVACTNYFSAQSNYFWKGALQEDQEMTLLLKTTPVLAQQAKQEILRIHSYETAYVAILSADVNKEYYAWVLEQTS